MSLGTSVQDTRVFCSTGTRKLGQFNLLLAGSAWTSSSSLNGIEDMVLKTFARGHAWACPLLLEHDHTGRRARGIMSSLSCRQRAGTNRAMLSVALSVSFMPCDASVNLTADNNEPIATVDDTCAELGHASPQRAPGSPANPYGYQLHPGGLLATAVSSPRASLLPQVCLAPCPT